MHENWCLIEKMYHITTSLEEFNNPIQNEPFRGCSHMGGQGAKSPPPIPPAAYLKSVTHILQNETWHSYTLLKVDSKE